MTNYISSVDTSKLIRKVLKREFPGHKFSVRTPHGTIRIGWVDGPTDAEVNRVVAPFEGSDFDGMIDLKYYKESWLLPDGTAKFGKSRGTVENAGADPSYDNPQSTNDAELVQFGADFIFTNRKTSRALVDQVAKEVYEEYRWPIPNIHTYQDGYSSFGNDVEGEDWRRSMEITRVYRLALQDKAG